MRKPVIAVLGVTAMVTVALGLRHLAEKGSHRARFILAMDELRRANAALHQQGAFTNTIQGDRVYPYTNRFTREATVYQCGLALESVDLYLRERGLLAITTNDVLLWIDRERGVMPLANGPAFAFPPRF
jgi:hypothetical protein